MIRCDALIVGGGPAGLAAAIALRQKGLDVLVADALRPPIDKACGEGLMPDAKKDLAALGIAASTMALPSKVSLSFPGATRRQPPSRAAAASASAACNSIRCWSSAARNWACGSPGAPASAWHEKQPLTLDGEPCHLSLRHRRGWPILPGAPGDGPGPGQNPEPPIRYPLPLSREAMVPHGRGALGRSRPSLHYASGPGRNLRGHRRPLPRHSYASSPRRPAGFAGAS